MGIIKFHKPTKKNYTILQINFTTYNNKENDMNKMKFHIILTVILSVLTLHSNDTDDLLNNTLNTSINTTPAENNSAQAVDNLKTAHDTDIHRNEKNISSKTNSSEQKKLQPGLCIVFEGIDGAGKRSLIEYLQNNSTLAYQEIDIDTEKIENLYKTTNHGVTINYIFFCKIDPTTACQRINKRANNNNFFDEIFIHKTELIAKQYEHIVEQQPTEEIEHIIILDMNEPIEENGKKCIAILMQAKHNAHDTK